MTQESNVTPPVIPGDLEVQSQPAEKMLPQSKVDEIVKHAKYDAAEKAKRSMMEQMPLQQTPQQPAAQPANVGLGGMTPDSLRQIIADETQKQQSALLEKAHDDQRMQEGQRIAGEFFQKLESGPSKYDDFDSVVGSLPFAKIPQVVQLAHGLDNTDDVMYDLATNPLKLSSLSSLASMDPGRAANEMRKLSDSIKKNQEAKRSEVPLDPLGQIKSSPTSTDSGSMSVKDYMKVFK